MWTEELKNTIANTWEEFNLLDEEDDIELKLDPTDKKPLLSKINPFSKPKLKIAFLYEKTPDSSDWTYGHELGRLHLEQAFPHEVETIHFENVTLDTVEFFIREAILEECNVIITTTPSFAQASVKAAIDHPKVHILNCSVNTSHRYIRTYYVRMHEVKFLMGAIAGAMAENDKITYIADYPIYGTIANINAFALGAKMVNPRAKVYLDWRCIKDNDTMENIKKEWLKETIGEGLYFTCVKRWGDGFPARPGHPAAEGLLVNTVNFQDRVLPADSRFFNWPIPTYEMQLNKELQQNPGYTIQ
jgi:hypothetical protein